MMDRLSAPTRRGQFWRRLALLIAASAPLSLGAQAVPTTTPTTQPRCNVQITIESPSAGATIRGGATLTGWALDLESPRGSGVEAVQLYLDGEAGKGLVLGVASVGIDRPDVDATHRKTQSRPGWRLAASLDTAATGGHLVYAYARSRCGSTFTTQVVNVAPADGWALLNPPPARHSHTAVWDPAGGQMLVLGGRGGGSLADLWSYSPATDIWTPLSSTSEGREAPIFAHSAIWDTSRGEMLVFGGFRGREGDGTGLWAFNPRSQAWNRRTPEGPSPRSRGYHTAVWTGAEMLVYSGLGGSFDFFGDLWSYRPETDTWRRLVAPRPLPEPRFFHSAVWDPVREQMLVFGGAADVDEWFVNDLWSYRPTTNTWTEVRTEGPRPPVRLAHGAVWDPVGGQMLVFYGGCGGCYLDDVWAYRPASNTWAQLTPPSPTPLARGGHTAVWDSARNQVLVYAGGSLNDVWAYRPTTNRWFQLAAGTVPAPAVSSHRAVWDPVGTQLLAFGGASGRHGAKPVNDLWSYKPPTNAWVQISQQGPAPGARLGHSIVWDPVRNDMILFGGTTGDRVAFDDLWIYQPPRNAWMRLQPEGPGPAPRSFHSAALDPVGAQMLLFGGQQVDGRYLDDLWAYNPVADAWTAIEPAGERPAGRVRHSAVWDSVHSRMLVFGGYSGAGGYTNELWAYRPSDNVWSQLETDGSGPAPRGRHGAAWDPAGQQMLVFGGYVGGVDFLGDLWSYRPATNEWTLVAPGRPAPGARADLGMAWDPSAGQLLIFGGSGGDQYADLWSYRPPSPPSPRRGA